jgi:hypothetical protein
LIVRKLPKTERYCRKRGILFMTDPSKLVGRFELNLHCQPAYCTSQVHRLPRCCGCENVFVHAPSSESTRLKLKLTVTSFSHPNKNPTLGLPVHAQLREKKKIENRLSRCHPVRELLILLHLACT